jgi:hypothetical protein
MGGFMNGTAVFEEVQRDRFAIAACIFGMLIAFATPSSFAQQIHQLSYNNSFWSDQSLNESEDYPSWTMGAFATTPNGQSHVYYVSSGTTQHVHQLFYNGVSWSDEDLTVLSGGPPAGVKGTVVGFSVGNFQYVYYLATSFHIHQLLYNNVSWKDSDLTAQSGSSEVALPSGLVAFTTSPALHVYYVAGDGSYNIRQLFSPTGTTWQDEALTNFVDDEMPVITTGFNIGNLQYVYWYDRDTAHTHQLSYNNSSWSDADLTNLIRPQFFGISAALAIPGTKKIRLYCMNVANGHLLQLSSPNNGKWSTTDLTAKSKGPSPIPGETILAFATTPNNGLHVFYEYKNQIYQTYQSAATSWITESLTQQGNGAPAVDFSDIQGFAVGNLQYVFYEAQ